jgi:hypothetical protein
MAATATIKLNHNTQEYRTDDPVQRRSLGHVQVYNALTPGEEGQHQRRVHVRTAPAWDGVATSELLERQDLAKPMRPFVRCNRRKPHETG